MTESEQEQEELRQLMPFMKSWKMFYFLVLGELALLILLFYLFSRYFA